MKALYILICFSCSMILNPKIKNQDSIFLIQSTFIETDKYIDAAFYFQKENKNYIFHQNQYSRYSNENLDTGYPTKIQNGWKDFPQYWNEGLDAALRCEPTKKTIFFKGREYYTLQNGSPVSTFPKKLPGEFRNLPRYFHSNIDAAVYLNNNQRVYLFKGNQYVRMKNFKVEQGYPKKMPGEFKQLPKEFCSDIDAVQHRDGYTFFYKNGHYVKHANNGGISNYQKKKK